MVHASSERPVVLLAHSFYLRDDPKQLAKMRPYPPLATLIAASALRERGHTVSLFDAMLAQGTGAFERMLDDVRPDVVALVEDSFNFLTKMCTLIMRRAALEMIARAKAAGARVVVHGPDAADHAAGYLAAGADAVILGEVEATLLDVVGAWASDPRASVTHIPGIASPGNNGSGIRTTPGRRAIEDLDALPDPAWDLVNAGEYRHAWTSAHGHLSWNMVTSRGCPYRCNWCAKPVFGTRYAQRSPARVADELARLRDTVAPDHIWFADDIFGLTAQWIQDFAHEIVAREARTPFLMQSRVNLMKPAVVEALTAAGAEEVWLGVESGSQRVLDAMDKNSRVEQVRSASRTLRRYGIRTGWFLQLGYPGERWEDIVRTRDLVREEQPDDVGVSVAYPLPGTVFHQRVREQLGERANWVDTGDLAMLFSGTYGTAFYRRVRDLLHAEVRAARTGAPGDLDREWQELAACEAQSRIH